MDGLTIFQTVAHRWFVALARLFKERGVFSSVFPGCSKEVGPGDVACFELFLEAYFDLELCDVWFDVEVLCLEYCFVVEWVFC
ncbi:hypothetical protein BCY86_06295 [Pajaroellobacter abortibovis]|uniref:Uncharacterized protein n=1 Tax=Pajaroellobacter abortibovis TaxID=1882918 RepID=A0A1L6MXW0_9BACT|nr:hypothetical protein BCY86_06295 [Pajaroellobacter abortibovis]